MAIRNDSRGRKIVTDEVGVVTEISAPVDRLDGLRVAILEAIGRELNSDAQSRLQAVFDSFQGE